MSLVDSAGDSASVLTLEETVLLWMDSATFQQALRENVEMALNLVRVMAARARLANDLVGASRKRVNQVIVSFKNQGLLSVDGDGRVTIHQRDGLARYCR